MSAPPPFGLSVHVYPSPWEHQTRIHKITEALVAERLVERVLVVSHAGPGLPEMETVGPGRQVMRIPTRSAGEGFFSKLRAVVGWSLETYRRLRSWPVDVVSCHSLSTLPLCVALASSHRATLVYEPHELETETVPPSPLRKWVGKCVEAALIGQARAVFVVSDSIAEHYRRAYRLPVVDVVLNVPPTTADVPAGSNRVYREAFGVPDDHLIFLYQGVLDDARGLRELLAVFRKLPADRHLVLMGYGPGAFEAEAAARDRSNIHVYPPVPSEEVIHHTRGADVGFALLTNDCLNHEYALPNKLFQCLHAGIPVIVSDLQEMRRVVERFACGWTTGPSEDDLARAITAIDRADVRARAAGAQRARAELHWGKESPKLASIYRRMSSSSGTPAYQVCKRCVMDTSVPDIEFDADGVCSYCRAASERLGREYFPQGDHDGRLIALVDQIKREGAGRKYDCVIGVSGGADSSYTVYLAKRKYGLRPLAVHFDNGWNSDLAVVNIERLLKALDVDLYTYVVDWNEFRDLQLSFLKSSVPNTEIPTDHAIMALMYRVAAKHGIKYIVHGGNLATESIMPGVWMDGTFDLRLVRSIQGRHGRLPLRTLPTLSLRRLAYYILVRRIKYVGLLNYVDYNKGDAHRILEGELGWRPYAAKHFESIFTRWFQGWLLPHKFGIDKRRAHWSSLIVSGQMTREEAVAGLREPTYDEAQARDDMVYVCRKFGLSREELDAIVAQRPRSNSEYPNTAWVWDWAGPIVAKAKRIATGRA